MTPDKKPPGFFLAVFRFGPPHGVFRERDTTGSRCWGCCVHRPASHRLVSFPTTWPPISSIPPCNLCLGEAVRREEHESEVETGEHVTRHKCSCQPRIPSWVRPRGRRIPKERVDAYPPTAAREGDRGSLLAEAPGIDLALQAICEELDCGGARERSHAGSFWDYGFYGQGIGCRVAVTCLP
jgi:hypothetical protein